MSKTQTRKRRRSYTSIACDFCKDRHRRCSGDKPICENCKKHQRICIYRNDRFENKKKKDDYDEMDLGKVVATKRIREGIAEKKAILSKGDVGKRKGVQSAKVSGSHVANNVSFGVVSDDMYRSSIGGNTEKKVCVNYTNGGLGLYNYERIDSPLVLGGYGSQKNIEPVYNKRTEYINSGSGYDLPDMNVYKNTNTTLNTLLTDNGYSPSVNIENMYKSSGYHSTTGRFDSSPTKPVYNSYEDDAYSSLDDFHGSIDYQGHYPHELSNDSPPPVFNVSGYDGSSSRYDRSSDMDMVYNSPNAMYSNDSCMNENDYNSPPLNAISHKEYNSSNGSHLGWYDEPLYREQPRNRELSLLSLKKVQNEKREKVDESERYPYEGGELFKFFIDWKGSSDSVVGEEEFRGFR